eukprot:jgi/Bigna1/70806/fgenesh1_pg.13_\
MRRDAVMWVGVWSPPTPEPHSWTPVGWTDMSPQPPVTRQKDAWICIQDSKLHSEKKWCDAVMGGGTDLSPQPPVTRQHSEGCVDLCSRFKVAFAEMALGGGFFGHEGGFSPHPCATFLFTGGAGHRRIGCQVKDFRICIQHSPRMNPVRMKVSSSNFVPSSRGCCGHCEARCPNGLGTKNASSSIFMPSSEGNVSAKAGDVVVGVKQTMKVWSMGLFSWGSQVWCSCLVISKHEQTITTGFGDAWS